MNIMKQIGSLTIIFVGGVFTANTFHAIGYYTFSKKAGGENIGINILTLKKVGNENTTNGII